MMGGNLKHTCHTKGKAIEWIECNSKLFNLMKVLSS